MIHALVEATIDASILIPLSDKDRHLLAEMCWMITLFWPNYLEVSGEGDLDDGLERGTEITRFLLKNLQKKPA